MKKLLFFIFIFINIFTLHSFADENGYIVKLKETPISLFSAKESALKPVIAEDNLFIVKSYEELKNTIPENMIEYIEPNGKFTLFNVPNDPYYTQAQWNLQMINAPYIWESGCFGQNIKVAVIDSGVNPHKEIKNNILEGYNYINFNTDVTDYDDHGTFVSGIIAAAADNSYGIAGLSHHAKIVPLKIFSGELGGTLEIIVRAIRDAVDKYDCDVINLSFGGPIPYTSLEEEIKYAVSKGVIVVAACGNNSGNVINYPASYDNVISVSSVDRNKILAETSTYNKYVDVTAPGEEVVSVLYKNNTSMLGSSSGTSFAAPHVSALAALCLNINPQMNAFEFMEILKHTSEDLGVKGRDDYYGYGLINAKNVLEYLLRNKEFFVSPVTFNNQGAYSVIYNNTNKTQNIFSIFKYSSDTSFSKKSINAKSGSKISFKISENPFTHYLWRSNLSPVFKRTFKLQ